MIKERKRNNQNQNQKYRRFKCFKRVQRMKENLNSKLNKNWQNIKRK